ncbi:CLIP domain-containing serine protease 2 [Papilio machaon]|uniref:CLIP domain-containing serine protease 2 n=1 Tax=Papilio machaon TaxID=76193 RepID=UPI001E662B09|nr:CLIP domain-containing serine protease 2 [Papilio machaon]
MKLLIKVVLGVLLFSIASCYKYCEDCILITRCEKALERVKHHKSDATVKMLKNAHCGFDGVTHKVCCTELMINMRTLEDDSTNEFDIEKHPNIKLLSEECGDTDGNKIVGGSRTTLYEFPWLAIIIHKNAGTLYMNCGGSLINSRYVLTAAHCIKGREVSKVRIGEYDLSTEIDCTGEDAFIQCAPKYQEIDVSEQIYHEAYNNDPLIINDIGLLRLKKSVDLSYRNSGLICLPITNSLLNLNIYGERGTVAGWGITESNTKSNVLLKVGVPIFSPRTCLRWYNRNRHMTMESYNRLTNTFCAGELGHDSCKGDSGGPLMYEGFITNTYKLVQYGIVSYGNLDCGTEPPTIYTDVRKYMKWIMDHIRP